MIGEFKLRCGDLAPPVATSKQPGPPQGPGREGASKCHARPRPEYVVISLGNLAELEKKTDEAKKEYEARSRSAKTCEDQRKQRPPTDRAMLALAHAGQTARALDSLIDSPSGRTSTANSAFSWLLLCQSLGPRPREAGSSDRPGQGRRRRADCRPRGFRDRVYLETEPDSNDPQSGRLQEDLGEIDLIDAEPADIHELSTPTHL